MTRNDVRGRVLFKLFEDPYLLRIKADERFGKVHIRFRAKQQLWTALTAAAQARVHAQLMAGYRK